jgi:hypothetical protein
LRHAQKASKGCTIIATAKLASHDSLTKPVRDRSLEIPLGQLGEFIAHVLSPMNRLKRRVSEVVANRALMIRVVSSSRSVNTTTTTLRRLGPIATNRSSSWLCSSSKTSR